MRKETTACWATRFKYNFSLYQQPDAQRSNLYYLIRKPAYLPLGNPALQSYEMRLEVHLEMLQIPVKTVFLQNFRQTVMRQSPSSQETRR